MRPLLLLLVPGFIGCREAREPGTVATIAAQAALRMAPAGSPAAWAVHVATDSVADAATIADSLRTKLHARARLDSDSLSHDLTLRGVYGGGADITLDLEVVTIQRCGPTWESTFGYSDHSLAYASRFGQAWQIDSIHPIIYGDPGICSSELRRLSRPDSSHGSSGS